MGFKRQKNSWNEKKEFKTIGLAGNPNVGKSTVFNALTGMNQHTGNWPGKTVGNASGEYYHQEQNYILYDLPGTYSLIAHSEEEECARNFICFGNADATIVVCDACGLERNLNLALQTIEITPNVILCVNLIDEAKKKKIEIHLDRLSTLLGVPVVGTSARSGYGLQDLIEKTEKVALKQLELYPPTIVYAPEIEDAIETVCQKLEQFDLKTLQKRWVALKLLDQETSLLAELKDYLGYDLLAESELADCVKLAQHYLYDCGFTPYSLKDQIVARLVNKAEEIAQEVITYGKMDYNKRDRKIDYYLTNRWTGIPIMIGMLLVVFWITITGANYPSELLFQFFGTVEGYISQFFQFLHFPLWLHDCLLLGVYRVLTWVVAVMLPPMLIFFPFFTLLEDLGYLPRIAFNLDHYFKKCCACGKQALTMCMGFGCNAVGVTGARIIDSPRERLLAIITNNFVPCNGRFPTIISIITMFFIGFQVSIGNSILSTVCLTGVILLGIMMTFIVSKLLSKTVLKGIPSSFTLELPPYRRPQIGKILVRSLFDRTLFVLMRAIKVAAPAGLVIWALANIQLEGISLLNHVATFLDPVGKLIGLDGVILIAFILGFPANEIVVPIMIMTYLASGTISEFDNLFALKELLVTHGWTWLTALNTMLFCLFHFPCSTTCLTIKKETGSWKWTILSFLIPTIIGVCFCFIITTIVRIMGLV